MSFNDTLLAKYLEYWTYSNSGNKYKANLDKNAVEEEKKFISKLRELGNTLSDHTFYNHSSKGEKKGVKRKVEIKVSVDSGNCDIYNTRELQLKLLKSGGTLFKLYKIYISIDSIFGTFNVKIPVLSTECTVIYDGCESVYPPREELNNSLVICRLKDGIYRCSVKLSPVAPPFELCLKEDDRIYVHLDRDVAEIYLPLGQFIETFIGKHGINWKDLMANHDDLKDENVVYYLKRTEDCKVETIVGTEGRDEIETVEAVNFNYLRGILKLEDGESGYPLSRFINTLAFMLKKLCRTKNHLEEPDDFHSYANRTFVTYSNLIYSQVYKHIDKHIRDLTYEQINDRYKFESAMEKMQSECASRVTKTMKSKGKGTHMNILQYNDFSFPTKVSIIRENIVPCDDSSRDLRLRVYSAGSYGYECPSEVQDDSSLGITNRLTAFSEYSLMVSKKDLDEVFKDLDVKIGLYLSDSESTAIFLDGKYRYHIQDSRIDEFISKMRFLPNGQYLSIIYNKDRKIIYIMNSNNRVVRPIINMGVSIMDATLKGINIEDLIKKRVIIFVDSKMLEFYGTSKNLNDVHRFRELHDAFALGYTNLLCPYSNFHKGARTGLATSQAKQAIPSIVPPDEEKEGKTLYVSKQLVVAQKPIVTTLVNETTEILAAYGANLVTAFMPYECMNIDDGLVINYSSVQRGLFQCRCVVTQRCDLEKVSLCCTEMNLPEGRIFYADIPQHSAPIANVARCNYNEEYFHQDSTIYDVYGIVEVGSIVTPQTVVFSYKTVTGEVYQVRPPIRYPARVIYKLVTRTSGGGDTPDNITDRTLEFRYAYMKSLELGDKLAPRNSQKGVTASIVSQRDMPFDEDGITPDILVNPSSLITRATCGYIKEAIQGIITATFGGVIRDGTTFTESGNSDMSKVIIFKDPEDYEKEVKELKTILKNKGKDEHLIIPEHLRKKREEVEVDVTDLGISQSFYTSGTTGLEIKGLVFRGIVSFILMTQQSRDKIKQNTKRGMRYGEQEFDGTMSLGTTCLLKEVGIRKKMDTYKCCKECGYIIRKFKDVCPKCGKRDMALVDIPTNLGPVQTALNAVGLDFNFVMKKN